MSAAPMHGCFVTGTDTEVGKTRVSAALLHWLGERGLRCAGYKPVAAGTETIDGDSVNEDVRALRNASSVALTDAEVGPCQFEAACAPHIAAALEGRSIARADLLQGARALAARAECLIVEGVGGFCVPLGADFDSADFAVDLGLPVVLVVGLRLGCISHALLSAEAIRARGLRLAGWVANTVDAGMLHRDDNLATLRDELGRRHQAPCLGVVPRLARPDPAAVAAHLDHAALRVLFGLPKDKFSSAHAHNPLLGINMSTTTISLSALRSTASRIPLEAEARWRVAEVEALFAQPFMELLFRAQQVHREHFDPNEVQLSTLLSIKTGGCAEDCGYCPQSAHVDTGIQASKLMPLEEVVEAALAAKAQGATRFCMGAAWRSPKARDMERVTDMVREVRALGLETCMTLGMLEAEQAQALKDAGLDYYNHNLDSAPEFYGKIISTRTYQDRLETLAHVRDAGINVCCGGIVGMGEDRTQRAGLIAQLANLDPYPESVPINNLVQVEGTPLAGTEPIDPFEFVRTVAVARITMPTTMVRLSAGREQMDEALQALCFAAGANSIFYGDKLLTTSNPQAERDRALFERLGLKAQRSQ